MALSMEKWKGKVAVVTGASDGIGAAISEELVKLGLKVVGLARGKERMEALEFKLSNQPGRLYPIKTDITKEDDVLQAFTWIKVNLGPVHILANCAGIVMGDQLTEGGIDKWTKVINTNVIGLSLVTMEAIKDMRANKVNGHIIHINDVGAHTIPTIMSLGMYFPSKYCIKGLAETLRIELRLIGSAIKVTSISPGLVDTGIVKNTDLSSLTELAQIIVDMPKLNPKDVAESVVYVLSTPPHVQVEELIIRPIGEEIFAVV